MDISTLRHLVHTFRQTLEPHWSNDLLYEKFQAEPDDTPSAGFCGPSSVLLFEKLTHEFPDQKFSIAVGKAYKNNQQWIRGNHVWIVWHVSLKDAVIIDITADQSRDLAEPCIVEHIDTLIEQGIYYMPYYLARSLDEVDASPKERAQKLAKKAGIR